MAKNAMQTFRLASLLAVAALSAAAPAVLSFVSHRAQLNEQDTITWDQFGPEFTLVPSGTLGNTASGDPFRVYTYGGADAEIRRQGTSWAGNFAQGDYLLWNRGSLDNMELRFSESYAAVALQIQSNQYGPFTGYVRAYDLMGFYLGQFDIAGDSTSAGDNSAITVGICSSLQDIGRLELRAFNEGIDFAVNQVSLEQCDPVPEPASLAALGLGTLALRRRRRKT